MPKVRKRKGTGAKVSKTTAKGSTKSVDSDKIKSKQKRKHRQPAQSVAELDAKFGTSHAKKYTGTGRERMLGGMDAGDSDKLSSDERREQATYAKKMEAWRSEGRDRKAELEVAAEALKGRKATRAAKRAEADAKPKRSKGKKPEKTKGKKADAKPDDKSKQTKGKNKREQAKRLAKAKALAEGVESSDTE